MSIRGRALTNWTTYFWGHSLDSLEQTARDLSYSNFFFLFAETKSKLDWRACKSNFWPTNIVQKFSMNQNNVLSSLLNIAIFCCQWPNVKGLIGSTTVTSSTDSYVVLRCSPVIIFLKFFICLWIQKSTWTIDRSIETN